MQKPLSREEQLAFCKICKHRKQTYNGLVCGLTDEIALFAFHCKNFEADTIREQQIHKAKEQKEKKGNRAKRTVFVMGALFLLSLGFAWGYSAWEASTRHQEVEEKANELAQIMEAGINQGDANAIDDYVEPSLIVSRALRHNPFYREYKETAIRVIYSHHFAFGTQVTDRAGAGQFRFMHAEMDGDTAHLFFRLYSAYEAFEILDYSVEMQGDQVYITDVRSLSRDVSCQDILRAMEPLRRSGIYWRTAYGRSNALDGTIYRVFRIRKQLNERDVDGAVASFHTIESRYSRFPMVKLLEYRVSQAESNERFTDILNEDLRYGPSDRRFVHFNRMNYYQAVGDVVRFKQHRDSVGSLIGQDELFPILEARAYMVRLRFEDAKQIWQRMADEHPDLIEPVWQKMICEIELNELQQAARTNSELHEWISPADPAIWKDWMIEYTDYRYSEPFQAWMEGLGVPRDSLVTYDEVEIF